MRRRNSVSAVKWKVTGKPSEYESIYRRITNQMDTKQLGLLSLSQKITTLLEKRKNWRRNKFYQGQTNVLTTHHSPPPPPQSLPEGEKVISRYNKKRSPLPRIPNGPPFTTSGVLRPSPDMIVDKNRFYSKVLQFRHLIPEPVNRTSDRASLNRRITCLK